MANIRINSLPSTSTVLPADVLPMDGLTTRKITPLDMVNSVRPFATQAEAEAGTLATVSMSPLTTAQFLAANFASTPAGRAMMNAADAAAQRGLLGLGDAAQKNTGTTAGTVAAGDDSRITGAAQKSANLSDLANAATARSNLGLGSSATLPVGTTAGTVAAGDDIRFAGVGGIADQATAEAGVSNTTLMSPLRTKQSITVNAELADYLNGLPDSEARSIGDKLRDSVSAGDFWLAIDADDTNSIQRAVDASTTVYLPAAWRPSGYTVSASISISLAGTSIFGDRRATRINVVDHDFDIFVCTAVGQVDVFDICSQNFGDYGASEAWFLRADDTYQVRINNVVCSNLTCGVKLGDNSSETGGSRSSIHNSQFLALEPTLGIGVLCEGGAELREFSHVSVSGGIRGFKITGGVSYSFNVVQCSQGTVPLEITPATGRTVAHIRLQEFWADSSGGDGVLLNGINGGISDFAAVISWASGNGGSGISISGVVRDFSWAHGRIYDNAANGIAVAPTADVRGMIIDANEIGGNAAAGISIDNNAGFYSIVNNNIGAASLHGPNGVGIYAATGAQAEQVITGNNLKGNTGGNVISKGADSVIDNNIGIKFKNSGTVSGTPTAGVLTAAHGLAAAPSQVFSSHFDSGVPIDIAVSSIDATNISFMLRNPSTGAAIATAQSVFWSAVA